MTRIVTRIIMPSLDPNDRGKPNPTSCSSKLTTTIWADPHPHHQSTSMLPRSTPPQAASVPHAASDDQASIDNELAAFEAIIRAAHDAGLRSATSTLTPDRWH